MTATPAPRNFRPADGPPYRVPSSVVCELCGLPAVAFLVCTVTPVRRRVRLSAPGDRRGGAA